LTALKKERLKKIKRLQEVRKKQLKYIQRAKKRKINFTKRSIEKKQAARHKDWEDYSKSFEFAGKNFKNNMHKHTIMWVIALVIFLVFFSAALLFIMRAIR